MLLLYYNSMYSCMWQPLCPRQISLGTNKVILILFGRVLIVDRLQTLIESSSHLDQF